MKPRPAKRRRESPCHSGEGVFDKLPDDLIEEILLRLPLCSVFKSRCVSKGWLSITTSPLFAELFERRHNQSEKDHSAALLFQDPLNSPRKKLLVCSGSSAFNCSDISFDFLPGLRTRRHNSITVLGSCHDLLLCCNKLCRASDYFIVNCVTREWVALPPAPRLHNSVLIGFVCDPASIGKAKKGAKLRYRVVRIPVSTKPETNLNVEIFSSEDGRWNEHAMECAFGRRTDMWFKSAVTCNGSLYWRFKYNIRKIMAMDPFKPGKEFIVIQNPPDVFNLYMRIEHLGIHGGKLRMSQTIFSNQLYEPSRLLIWELEEGDGGARWRSVADARLAAIIAGNDSYVQMIRSAYGCRFRSWITLALHPIAGDIIYFGCTLLNKIICCNLKTNSLEIVCDYRLDDWHWNLGDAFPIVLPCWPTPIPAMPKL